MKLVIMLSMSFKRSIENVTDRDKLVISYIKYFGVMIGESAFYT